MSWVFLTDLHAYKLKKPVCNDEVDARSVEQRHFYCNEKLRLNRRLAPQIYLAMVPLSLEGHGHLQLDGRGEAMDSLVKMRRLPAALMLDHALAAETASEETLRPAIAVVAAFYQACAPLAMTPAAYRRRLATVMAKTVFA